ncbi:hypothetical protein E2C01_066154 [Portunus trituberculatus]|uniref:Uncharacterized protein n=1 Tax=Portunus trituberculatus TaxID=210409 RepID=A0A5B7HTR5_PORTR|nr:hypothetical protein [Portunus trituberculatus]
MATPTPASESTFVERTMNFPRSSFSEISMFTTSFGFPLLSLTILIPPQDPPKQRCLQRFTNLGDLRTYYSDFPWNDYCFSVRGLSLRAGHITEVIVSGMEAYIPHSFT